MGVPHRKIKILYVVGQRLIGIIQSQGRATKLELPRTELKIDDAVPRQHAAKKAMAQSGITASDPSEPPAWMRHMMPFMGMALGSVIRNNPSPFETPQPAAVQPQPTAGPSRLSPPIFDPPSSGTKRAAAVAAPSIDNWLLSIDNDKAGRGRHSTKFFQFALKFEDQGFYDLTDMENIEAKDLATMIEAPIGVANRLVKYAKEDMDKITNAAKRSRRS